jgi:ABC-type multidrug transport system fused ATPase/permease subunit
MEQNLYRYIIRRSLRHQLTLTAIIFVSIGVGLIPLDLQKRIINKAIAMGDLTALLWLCAAFLVAVLAGAGLKYVITNYVGWISETMLSGLRRDLYQRILRFPLPHFRNTSAGQLIAMIVGEVEELGIFFGEALSTPIQHGLTLLALIGYMAYLNPWMALAGVAVYPFQIWLIPKLQRRVSALSRDRVKLVRGLSDRIQESVAGAQEIYANDTVAFESSVFGEWLDRIFRVRIRIYNLKYLIKQLNNFLAKLGPFLLFLIGGWFIITRPGSFDIGSLVAFLSAYERLNEPWRELLNYYQQKDVAEVKYEQVIANFEVPGLRPPFPVEERPPEPLPELAGAYEARGASVLLDGTTAALDKVQFATPPHQHIAIVGTPGSGKSTLTLVLAKLYGYSGTILLDRMELDEVPAAVAGRRIAYVGPDPRLFTGTLFENLVYGLRHHPATRSSGTGDGGRDGGSAGPGDWLDLTPVGVADRAGLVAVVLETARLVGLDQDLFVFGLRATIDPEKKPEIAARLLTARRLVMERFGREGGEAAVEFFDRGRFAAYASIGENILFGQSAAPELALDRLAEHEHFRRVIAEVDLRGPLLVLGAGLAREMVEIFKDIPADHELFANFSLITATELPEYVRLVSRLERGVPEDLPADDQQRLIALSLRLIPARHRLGRIDAPFMAKVVAARRRFAETLPSALAGSFQPYDRERYFAHGTLLDNILFGKVIATSSLAVKKVNAIAEEVITTHNLRDAVMEAGLDSFVGLAGSRLSPVQRQKVAVARAMLKRPQILILDEAVGAFEEEWRAEMHQRLTAAMEGRTILAVLERPELARYYDRVLVLDAGKVAEAGTFEELAAKEGLFRHLAGRARAAA